MKQFILTTILILAPLVLSAQTLDRFTVDDAPFIYTTRGGEFSDFKITHLPDQRRLEWLKNNQAE